MINFIIRSLSRAALYLLGVITEEYGDWYISYRLIRSSRLVPYWHVRAFQKDCEPSREIVRDYACLDVDQHVARLAAQREMRKLVAEKMRIEHPGKGDCVQCNFYHGADCIVCALHPAGPSEEVCRDWEPQLRK